MEQDAILLDVRTAQEYREQHIPGSLHLNYMELSPQSAAMVLGKPDGRRVMIYCRSGKHSEAAAEKLRSYGYNAVDMGSIGEWSGPLEGSFYK